MAYSAQALVEAGLSFKTKSGVLVRTTGKSVRVESHQIFVHEVEVVSGPGQGNRFLHNLDHAQPA
jgi:hypothetical protein